MIKSIILISMAFACAMADVSAQYAGTTAGAAAWNPPNLDGTSACTASTGNNYATVSFNVTFPSAGVREIAAMAEDNFKDEIRIYVYLGGFPATPCAGIVHNYDLTNQFSFDGGPVIDDFLYFTAATYTFVVTGSTEGGIFAVHVNPSDQVGQLTNAGPFWVQPETDTTDGACEEVSSSSGAAFGTYSFTAAVTGWYDIIAMYVNTTYGVGSYSYVTLYRGIPSNQELSINPCNTSAAYISSIYSDADGTYLPYVNLTAGTNYTLVVSLEVGYYGYWALQVIPTRIRFFNPTGFIQPNREDTSSTAPCSPSDLNAPWGATFFTAEESVYVIDTASPPYPFSYLDTYSFLYEGLNTANPPTTCTPTLILGGDTGDVTPVYAFTEIGVNYTVIVSTYSATSIDPTSAYVLYFFTGNAIGSIPSITTAASATTGTVGVGTNGVGTTGAGTTGNGVSVTAVTATSATVAHAATGTTSDASSVALSLAAVAAVVSAFL